MLPIKFPDKDPMMAKIHDLMDKGFLHRHLQEDSTLQEMTLSLVPYWIVPVSARTSITAANMMQQTAQTATTAALMGVVLGGLAGGGGEAAVDSVRAGYGRPRCRRIHLGLGTARLGMFMGGGMGGGGGARKAEEMDNNYNFPVVALKALTEYQPKDYVFNLSDRTLFDVSKVPKGIPILNGDVGEDDAKNQAKTYVDQVQSQKAHDKYHMIQQMHTDMDVCGRRASSRSDMVRQVRPQGRAYRDGVRRELRDAHHEHRSQAVVAPDSPHSGPLPPVKERLTSGGCCPLTQSSGQPRPPLMAISVPIPW